MSRLGEGLERARRDSTGAARSAPQTQSRTWSAEAKRDGAVAIAAVGTAVFRIASNGKDAVAAISDAPGSRSRSISGEEESRLAYLAAKISRTADAGEVVVFDTGGGSSQFTYGSGASVVDRFSVNVGAVSYTERFAPGQGRAR